MSAASPIDVDSPMALCYNASSRYSSGSSSVDWTAALGPAGALVPLVIRQASPEMDEELIHADDSLDGVRMALTLLAVFNNAFVDFRIRGQDAEEALDAYTDIVHEHVDLVEDNQGLRDKLVAFDNAFSSRGLHQAGVSNDEINACFSAVLEEFDVVQGYPYESFYLTTSESEDESAASGYEAEVDDEAEVGSVHPRPPSPIEGRNVARRLEYSPSP